MTISRSLPVLKPSDANQHRDRLTFLASREWCEDYIATLNRTFDPYGIERQRRLLTRLLSKGSNYR